jgi:hypothetical protein|tara:strand:- start:1161 stop:1847 length:687 start_codon:yes stop_codon:yes gene_type:complete
MKINNESFGQTVEKVICDLNGIKADDLVDSSIPKLEPLVRSIVVKACEKLPKIIRHLGSERGKRGGQSKSTVDFYCDNGKTISVKTSKNPSNKVCPSECGQPGNETFDLYFSHLYEGSITYQKFKKLCLEKSHEMMPIYLEHLFDCDYFLYVYFGKREMEFKVIKKEEIPSYTWYKDKISFTKNLQDWNESCTIKYNSKSIGEYQVHHNRNCYKFRFNLINLCELLGV